MIRTGRSSIKIGVLLLLFTTFSLFSVPGFFFPSLFAQSEEEPDSSELQELDFWKVSLLPFIVDGGQRARSIPLSAGLRDSIVEQLQHLPGRELSENERSWLSGQNIQMIQGTVPVQFELIESAPGSTILMFQNQLRSYIQDSQPFSPDLLEALASATDSQMFISGSVVVEQQYAFIELLILSPAEALAGNDPVVHSQLFSVRSIEAFSGLEPFIAGELGAALHNSAHGSINITWVPLSREYRIYLNNAYRGNRPATLYVVPPGKQLIELFDGNDLVLSREIDLAPDEDALLSFIPEPPEPFNIMLSTTPSGLEVYQDSSFLGFSPLRVGVSQTGGFVQFRGESVRESYVFLGPGTPRNVLIQVPDNSFDWRLQMSRDRRDFYGSLGTTILLSIIPLFAEGFSRNLIGAASGLEEGPARDQLFTSLYVSRTVAVAGLFISILSLLDTVDQLSVYLESAEAARGVLPAPR